MELRCRRDRSAQEQELEAAAARHKLEVQSLNKAQERKLMDEEHAQQLRYTQEANNLALQTERAKHEADVMRQKELDALHAARLTAEAHAELQKYEGFKAMGVDLSSYLVAMATATPDQHIKLDHVAGPPPTVHLELPRKGR